METIWEGKVRGRGVPLLLAVTLPAVLIIAALALALAAGPPRVEAHARLTPVDPGARAAHLEGTAHVIPPPVKAGPAASAIADDKGPLAEAPEAARQRLLTLPLRFIANAGQTDPSVRFTVQGAGHTFFFTPQEIVFTARAPEPMAGRHGDHPAVAGPREEAGQADLVRLRFLGANPNPEIEGVERLPGEVNYLLGNDPAQWRTNVPTYAAVVYRALYPGIDLVYRGSEGRLKSEFHVAPGADPGVIVMAYSGLESLRLRADGALVLETPLGELIEEAPIIYQEVNGARQEVHGGYAILTPLPVGGGGQGGQVQRVAFRVSPYNRALPLVFDPSLVFSTYLGGTGEEVSPTLWGHSIAVDSDGNVYVAGTTDSVDFPTYNPIQGTSGGGYRDAFVTQIVNASGVYTYGFSTYLGGTGYDWGQGIAVDGEGNAYVLGITQSGDFPTHNPIQPTSGGFTDAFVTQIVNASGVYTYGFSTYLGGSDAETSYGIAVDGAGTIYVTGKTVSGDFPTYNALDASLGGGQDAFVTQIISASGVYTYGFSTYLGGTGYDWGYGIAVDGAGNGYVTGETTSGDFPTYNALDASLDGSRDAFVTQIISASGVYTYGFSTYLGGTASDWGSGIAVDGDGNVYVAGPTSSADFPTHDAIQGTRGGGTDTFVTQIIDVGGHWQYGFSTYLGGSQNDWGYGMAVDGAGNAYVTGDTASADFPTYNALDASLGGNRDAFVTQIVDASGVYTYGFSTYLGGSVVDIGCHIAVDGKGNACVTGYTSSPDFPTTHNAIQATRSGDNDIFVAIIGPPPYTIHLPLVLKTYTSP